MKQYSKSWWFESLFVNFSFAQFQVERLALDNICDFEIRQAILEHLVSMFNSHCPEGECVEEAFLDPDSICIRCKHDDFLTNHTSECGVSFCVRTWAKQRLTRVYLD